MRAGDDPAAERPSSRPGRRARRDPFYLLVLLAMSATAFVGFSFTYFGPLGRGVYPDASATVHLHGWAFFGWYLLAPIQASLVQARRIRVHRLLGTMSVGLALVMVVSGLVVAAVQVDAARGPGGSPFWAFMGLPILSLLLLFAAFYIEAVRRRREPAYHRRLILLATAAGLPAATFRIAVRFLGFDQWVWVLGFSLPIVFLAASVAHDLWRNGRVHPVNQVGVPVAVGFVALVFLVVPTPVGDALAAGVGWLGGILGAVY